MATQPLLIQYTAHDVDDAAATLADLKVKLDEAKESLAFAKGEQKAAQEAFNLAISDFLKAREGYRDSQRSGAATYNSALSAEVERLLGDAQRPADGDDDDAA